MMASAHGLCRVLDGIDLADLTGADKEIQKFSEHLTELQYVLEVVRNLRECESEVSLARAKNNSLLETITGESITDMEGPDTAFASVSRRFGLMAGDEVSGLSTESAAKPQTSLPAVIFGIETARAGTEPSVGPNRSDDQPKDDKLLTVVNCLSLEPPSAETANIEQLPEPAADTIEHNVAGADRRTDEITSAQPLPVLPAQDSAAAHDNGTTQLSSAPSSSFDTKLLDALIENYGEFISAPNLPAMPEEASQSFLNVAPPKVHSARNTSFESPSELTVDQSSMAVRDTTDIDRKLKRLIQDYGEYDLYSRGAPVKTKIRVGGAFILLAAVLGGIYYFSAPGVPSQSVANPTTETAPAVSNDAGANPTSPPLSDIVPSASATTQPATTLERSPTAAKTHPSLKEK